MKLDKALHFLAGFLFGFFGGLCIAVFAGFLKEVWDIATGDGTPEWADFWWTCGGGLAGSVVAAAVGCAL